MISPETLRRYPLFAGLDEEVLKQIAMLGDEQAVKAEAWLFREGDDAQTLYLVLDGAVSLTINMDEKGERVEEVSTHGTGEVLGWSALVDPYTYTLGAQAAQDTRVAAIDALALRNLMDENPEAGYRCLQNVAKAMGERLVNLRVQFISLTVD